MDNLLSYSLPGYASLASFRSNKAGGGTSLYINQSLKPIALDINHAAITNDSFNISAALLAALPQPVAIVVGYLAPWASSSDAKALIDCLQGITTVRRPCLVVGDFNLPHVCWTDSSQTANEYKSVCFQSFVDSANLLQLIAEPTRKKSILDLTLVSPGITVTSVGLMPPIGTSDHGAQYFEIGVREKITLVQQVPQRTFPKLTLRKPCHYLINWTSLASQIVINITCITELRNSLRSSVMQVMLMTI